MGSWKSEILRTDVSKPWLVTRAFWNRFPVKSRCSGFAAKVTLGSALAAARQMQHDGKGRRLARGELKACLFDVGPALVHFNLGSLYHSLNRCE